MERAGIPSARLDLEDCCAGQKVGQQIDALTGVDTECFEHFEATASCEDVKVLECANTNIGGVEPLVRKGGTDGHGASQDR